MGSASCVDDMVVPPVRALSDRLPGGSPRYAGDVCCAAAGERAPPDGEDPNSDGGGTHGNGRTARQEWSGRQGYPDRRTGTEEAREPAEDQGRGHQDQEPPSGDRHVV